LWNLLFAWRAVGRMATSALYEFESIMSEIIQTESICTRRCYALCVDCKTQSELRTLGGVFHIIASEPENLSHRAFIANVKRHAKKYGHSVEVITEQQFFIEPSDWPREGKAHGKKTKTKV